MGWQHICLPNQLTDQTITSPNKRRKRLIQTWAKRSLLQGRPQLIVTLGVHQNIPASDTKLTHSLGIYCIGPPLVMDKLILVNSRVIMSPPEMSPLLDVQSSWLQIQEPATLIYNACPRPGSQSTTTNRTETHRSGSWKGPAHHCRVFCRPQEQDVRGRVNPHKKKP